MSESSSLRSGAASVDKLPSVAGDGIGLLETKLASNGFIARNASMGLGRLLAMVLVISVSPAAHADITVISNPVAPPFLNADGTPADGTGLCMAAAISLPASPPPPPECLYPLNLDNTNYVDKINAFFDCTVRIGTPLEPGHRVIHSLFDLSNNVGPESEGDFVNADPRCPLSGGCGFIYDTNLPNPDYYTSRIRGFINVADDWVNRDVHIAFYLDDSVSIYIYSKGGSAHPVYVLPRQKARPTWRFSETVFFEEAGIYPVEILHSQIGDYAALEVSFFVGLALDRPKMSVTIPIPPDTSFNPDYQLFPETRFFQTLSGSPSFPDINDCEQCNRQFVNQSGANACDEPGYYCNEAALCAPCDSAIFCGPTCSPCNGDTPHCYKPNDGEYQCVECIEDDDCTGDYTCHPDTNQCNECVEDIDCPRGESCLAGECAPCSTSEFCAGNSCNCCPTGAGGALLQCAMLAPDGPPVCMECVRDSDCAEGECDVDIGRCVAAVGHCGGCPPEYPFCLPGTLGSACAQCRFDTDCPAGNFCLSGECRPCTNDRRCGVRCEACTGDEPFCRDVGTAELSICVQCEDDSHCPAGTCDLASNRCESTCSTTCGTATPFCMDGDRCVECFADVHCPCNGSCDPISHTCNSACRTNRDCQGNEHCAWNDDFDEKECKLGPNVAQSPCSPLTGCISPLTCAVAVGMRPAISLGGLLLLGLFGLVLARRFLQHYRGRGNQ